MNDTLFNNQIRKVWDKTIEEWFFSVVDIIGILTESVSPRKYWNKLSQRLKEEGSESVTNCHQLKLKASDNKFYLTDVADTKTILRIIQSIPSKKAEPFKLWLASVGSERLDESMDPEISINRAMKNYLRLGKSEKWINQRLKSIEVRKELTDEWKDKGVKEGVEFSILTNEMLQTWSGMSTRKYKEFKELKKESLKDNMTNLELVINMLAEVSTTEISKKTEPQNFEENKNVAVQGGEVAKKAREDIENKTKESIISNNKEKFIKLDKVEIKK